MSRETGGARGRRGRGHTVASRSAILDTNQSAKEPIDHSALRSLAAPFSILCLTWGSTPHVRLSRCRAHVGEPGAVYTVRSRLITFRPSRAAHGKNVCGSSVRVRDCRNGMGVVGRLCPCVLRELRTEWCGACDGSASVRHAIAAQIARFALRTRFAGLPRAPRKLAMVPFLCHPLIPRARRRRVRAASA